MLISPPPRCLVTRSMHPPPAPPPGCVSADEEPAAVGSSHPGASAIGTSASLPGGSAVRRAVPITPPPAAFWTPIGEARTVP